MPIKSEPTEYPLIDSDPHFWRVVRYFRPADVGTIGLCTGLSCGYVYLMNKWQPSHNKFGLAPVMRLTACTGLVGGFLIAYARSSYRFWGTWENAREVSKDYAEMRERAEKGLPLYGATEMSEYAQGVAMRQSVRSQGRLAVFPWFNFANHKFHNTEQDYFKGIEHLRPESYRTHY
ncbi:NADH-ubiquinone oxidoreductase, 21kDa subunit, N-terminal [Phaffia rhodozyma]|uniref:NADH-ubiquinone oxidoreductase, 21kDa subunit, N-terminal n=1 Tax=Phaffia rhodozyma TaxID=264483 RepID=A0A0F7SE56_PHARH|nr:NADH-ubiquinone oxidoreductase, 21kDa subunit, N-terminal [Phaffia rhodozyma]